MAQQRAWLLMAAGASRQHAGNQGYDDQPDAFYSWDDTVAHHSEIQKGDLIAIWDKVALVGVSVIENVERGSGMKTVRKCPNCGRSSIKQRQSITPAFRCHQCRHEFDQAIELVMPVRTYRSIHPASWIDLTAALSGAELRAVCSSPRSQQSLRPLDWDRFISVLGGRASPRILNRLTDSTVSTMAADGHRLALTRARRGQSHFRGMLIERFGSNCAVTGPAPLVTLEAAHLYSYAEYAVHHNHGGLLLRRDVHRLFDRGDLAIEPDHLTIDVDAELAPFATYSRLQGQEVKVDINTDQRSWLEKHWMQHRTGEPSLGLAG
jgi:ribosomal protein L37AE/L43A